MSSHVPADDVRPIKPVTSAWRSLLALLFALVLAGCGNSGDSVCGDNICDAVETASDCAQDCGCGNGLRNLGESCDGADLGTGSCQSEVQAGGTIACNSDCTFDLSGCSMCGNGVAEGLESCDDTDLGGADCTTVGFSGGDLACDTDCSYDVSACCNGFCVAESDTRCVLDTLQVCTVDGTGCLFWDDTDCTATNYICDASNSPAMCICIDRCPMEGDGRCAGAASETCTLEGDGCLAWVLTTDCSLTAEACAVGPQGPQCVADAIGDCTDPYPVANGVNLVAWSAVTPQIPQPSCTAQSLAGPGVVLSYTAAADGILTYTMDKPTSTRYAAVASSQPCGTLAPELSCVSDFTNATMGGLFGTTMGTTYYFYVSDTTSGTQPLQNPFTFTINDTACGGITTTATNLSPANGATVLTFTPVLTVNLDHPVNPAIGVITVTGTLGTNASYDLSTAPPQVSVTNNGLTLTIDPGLVFLGGENVTVSWSGMVDSFCGGPIASPPWSFTIINPSCSPGVAGMVGTTQARFPTTISTITEYYVAADTDPNGYVYVGGTADIYRMPKAGGVTENVEILGGLTTAHLGYDMLIAGTNIFTLNSSTVATTGVLWRISTSGGVTWNVQDYAMLPSTPTDDLRGVFHDPVQGRIYMVGHEGTLGVDTQMWSVSDGAGVLPDVAVLEGTIAGERNCSGLAADNTYFYLACGTGDRLVRVDRTTFVSELLTDTIDLSTTKNTVHAHDFDGDGTADALYVQNAFEQVHYVCGPAAAGPYWVQILADFGGTSFNYGLGFDSVANTLWAYDDDTEEFVSIK